MTIKWAGVTQGTTTLDWKGRRQEEEGSLRNGLIAPKYVWDREEIASYNEFCLNLRIYDLLETLHITNRRQHTPPSKFYKVSY